MLAIGMGALQIMLDKGQEEDWFGSRFIVILAMLAVAFLAAFVIRELRTPEPIVRFRLLRHRNFAVGVSFAWVLGFVLYGSLILLPLFMQTLLGWTAMTAGFWTSPRGIGTALLMPVVGYMLGKGWDGRWMLAVGFVVASLALFGFSSMTLESGTWDIFFHQIEQGLGMAFVFVPLTTLTMDPIPRIETGYATSLYSVMRNIGSSMGISFVTTWLARRAQFHQSVLAANVTPYSTQFRQLEGQISNMLFLRGGADPTTAGNQSLALIYGMIQRQASLLSFIEAFRILGIGFLACTALILLMRASKHRRNPSAQSH
jgi:DHA2 family multidrug resistance protein